MSLLTILAIAASQPAAASDVKAGVDAWRRGDHAAAVRTWRPLADAGDAHAQFNLAQAYKLGRGVTVDASRAIDLYRLAARQGHREAGALLGLMLFQDGRQAEAMPHVIAAANAGEPGAQYVYATALFNGDHVGRDLAAAYAMMTRAAAGGVPQAAASLAEMEGHIPEPDRRRGRALAQADTVPPDPARVGAALSTSVPTVPRVAAPTQNARAASSVPALSWRVQLGAFGQPANADALFERLKGRVGALRGSQSYLVRAGAVTRLQAGPFTSRSAAETACRAVQAAGGACFAVAP